MAAMARLDVVRECAAGYLIYMAVGAKRRNGGIGGQFFEEMARRLRAEELPVEAMLFEVDDPDHRGGAEREAAGRRIQFYRRHGARYLTGAHYIQRVEFYPDGVPMRIGVLPLREITPERAWEMTSCLFGEDIARTGAPLFLE